MNPAKSTDPRAADAESTAEGHHALLSCEACERIFLDARRRVGDSARPHRGADAPPSSSRAPKGRCACGGGLRAASIAPGLYALELVQASPRVLKGGRASLPMEDDLGYGESHGYGPGHGGPTGPGDAPATEPPTRIPVDEDERP